MHSTKLRSSTAFSQPLPCGIRDVDASQVDALTAHNEERGKAQQWHSTADHRQLGWLAGAELQLLDDVAAQHNAHASAGDDNQSWNRRQILCGFFPWSHFTYKSFIRAKWTEAQGQEKKLDKWNEKWKSKLTAGTGRSLCSSASQPASAPAHQLPNVWQAQGECRATSVPLRILISICHIVSLFITYKLKNRWVTSSVCWAYDHLRKLLWGLRAQSGYTRLQQHMDTHTHMHTITHTLTHYHKVVKICTDVTS